MELNGRKWGAIVMLMGEYNHTIDAKGRLIVPAKFREVLGDEFVVTKGLDNCLFVYPNDEWQKFEEKLQTLPLTNKNARQFTRFFLMNVRKELEDMRAFLDVGECTIEESETEDVDWVNNWKEFFHQFYVNLQD